jgi:hypothetical protein
VVKKAGHDVEVHRDNYQARFVPWYGPTKAPTPRRSAFEKCGLCGGNPFKRDNFRDCVLRLMAQVTEQNLKRVD